MSDDALIDTLAARGSNEQTSKSQVTMFDWLGGPVESKGASTCARFQFVTTCWCGFIIHLLPTEWGPGGNAPIDWCHAHGITDPLSVLEVRQYYYDHLRSTTDLRVGSVHLESVYSERYGPWNPLQTQQFIEGEENTDSLTLAQDNADSIRAAEFVKLRCSAATVNGTQSEAA